MADVGAMSRRTTDKGLGSMGTSIAVAVLASGALPLRGEPGVAEDQALPNNC
jgi:hypothetical protein